MAPARINLAAERLNRGLTIPKAAEAMGVTDEVLAYAEKTGRLPRADNAFKIATFFERKVTDIWGVPDEPGEVAA